MTTTTTITTYLAACPDGYNSAPHETIAAALAAAIADETTAGSPEVWEVQVDPATNTFDANRAIVVIQNGDPVRYYAFGVDGEEPTDDEADDEDGERDRHCERFHQQQDDRLTA